MNLKLDESLPESDSPSDDDGYYHAPVQTETPVITEVPKKQVHIPTFVIILLACAVIAIILKVIPFNKKTALNETARLPQASIEAELGLTLEHNPDFVTRLSIPNNSPEGLDTYTNAKESFSVIYYNGKQFGISFTDPKYTLFGIKIGDSESHLMSGKESASGSFEENGVPVFEYTNYFVMMEDLAKSGSTAEYFLGKDGSVLVLVINDTTNRVVNIIYYYDSERVMQDISLF